MKIKSKVLNRRMLSSVIRKRKSYCIPLLQPIANSNRLLKIIKTKYEKTLISLAYPCFPTIWISSFVSKNRLGFFLNYSVEKLYLRIHKISRHPEKKRCDCLQFFIIFIVKTQRFCDTEP